MYYSLYHRDSARVLPKNHNRLSPKMQSAVSVNKTSQIILKPSFAQFIIDTMHLINLLSYIDLPIYTTPVVQAAQGRSTPAGYSHPQACPMGLYGHSHACAGASVRAPRVNLWTTCTRVTRLTCPPKSDVWQQNMFGAWYHSVKTVLCHHVLIVCLYCSICRGIIACAVKSILMINPGVKACTQDDVNGYPMTLDYCLHTFLIQNHSNPIRSVCTTEDSVEKDDKTINEIPLVRYMVSVEFKFKIPLNGIQICRLVCPNERRNK